MIVTAWKADVLQRMLNEYAKARLDGDPVARSMTFDEWVEQQYPPQDSATRKTPNQQMNGG